MFKVAKETLEITEDNPNENIFKKQPTLVFYENFAKFSRTPF